MGIFKDTTSYMITLYGHDNKRKHRTVKVAAANAPIEHTANYIEHTPSYIEDAYNMTADAFKDFKLEVTFKEHRFYFLRTLLERQFRHPDPIIPFGWYEMELFIDGALEERKGKDKTTAEYIRDLKVEFDKELSTTEYYVYRINPTKVEDIELERIDLYNGVLDEFDVSKLTPCITSEGSVPVTNAERARIFEQTPGWRNTKLGRQYAAHFQRYPAMLMIDPWSNNLYSPPIRALLLTDDTCIIEIDYKLYKGTRVDYYELMKCHPLAFTEKLTATF